MAAVHLRLLLLHFTLITQLQIGHFMITGISSRLQIHLLLSLKPMLPTTMNFIALHATHLSNSGSIIPPIINLIRPMISTLSSPMWA